MIWMWLAFKLAPQMESMVMNLESWNDISVRESIFRFAFPKSGTCWNRTTDNNDFTLVN